MKEEEKKEIENLNKEEEEIEKPKEEKEELKENEQLKDKYEKEEIKEEDHLKEEEINESEKSKEKIDEEIIKSTETTQQKAETIQISIYNSSNNNLDIQDKYLKIIIDNFTKGFNISSIDNGEDEFFHSGNVQYTLTTTTNQRNNKNKNISIIDLGECEIKLKQEYNILLNDSLYILKVDTYIGNIPKIVYEIIILFNQII